MPGLFSRNKGKDFERLIARKLRTIFPEAKRGLQSREGKEAPDVQIPCFWVECKRHRQPNIRAAMKQAQSDSDNQKFIPVAITKADRDDILVTMKFDDWMEVVSDWWKHQNQ